MRIHAASAAPAAVQRESITLYYAWRVMRHAATKNRTDRSLGPTEIQSAIKIVADVTSERHGGR